MLPLLIPAFLAATTSFIVAPIVVRIARRFNLMDDPRRRPHPAHTHQGTIPRAGGLILFLGILIPGLIFLPFSKSIVGIMMAAGLTTLIGLWDDRRDLSPYIRFIGNIVTGAIVVGSGIGVPFITNPLNGIIHLDTWRITFTFFGTHSILVWADIFAILWLVWTMNIVGWSSGVDGQMPGFVAIAAVILGFSSLRFSAHDLSQTVVATLAFIVAGSFLGFLPWNFYPQKIMPGYGGKTLGGLMIATLAILSGNKVGSALLVLAVPTLDAFYTLFRRTVNKKSPFQGDRSHLHHRLLDLGWGKRRIALFYWGVSALLGLVTLAFNREQKIFTFVVISVAIVGALVWLTYLFSHTDKSHGGI